MKRIKGRTGLQFLPPGDMQARTAAGDADAAVTGVLQRRLRGLSVVNLLVLFSAVAAMVFKPTL